MNVDSNTSLEIVREQVLRAKEMREQRVAKEKEEKRQKEITNRRRKYYAEYKQKGINAKHKLYMEKRAEQRKEQLKRMEEIIENGGATPEVQMFQELLSWGVADYNKPEEVADKFNRYLSSCRKYEIKPGVEGTCLALGMNRKMYDKLRNGIVQNAPKETVALFQQIHQFLTAEMEYYMLHGKLNPASAIFILKNCYGYRDTVEQVITKEDKEKLDIDSIRERYLLEEK